MQWLASSDSEEETEVGISDDDLHRDSTSEAGSTDTEMFEAGLMDAATPPARPPAERQGSPTPADAQGSCGGGPVGGEEAEAGGGGDVCAVCTDEIAPPLRCQSFPCLHPFCIPCMKTWIPLRNTCPLCNTPVAYLIVGVTASGSFSTIPIVNDPRTRVEAEAAVRSGTAVDFIWTGNPRTAPRSLSLGGHTVRALSPTPPWPGTDDEDDDLADGEGGRGSGGGRAGVGRGSGGGRALTGGSRLCLPLQWTTSRPPPEERPGAGAAVRGRPAEPPSPPRPDRRPLAPRGAAAAAAPRCGRGWDLGLGAALPSRPSCREWPLFPLRPAGGARRRGGWAKTPRRRRAGRPPRDSPARPRSPP